MGGAAAGGFAAGRAVGWAFAAAGVSDTVGVRELPCVSAGGTAFPTANVSGFFPRPVRDDACHCLATALLHPSRHPVVRAMSTTIPITNTAKKPVKKSPCLALRVCLAPATPPAG